jgi:hypothetical protein
MSETGGRSFYRIAKRFPPGDDEYQTAFQRGRKLPPNASDELKASWTGLSAYDTLQGANGKALEMRGRLGELIVRFDIPESSRIAWKKTLGPGHFDLYGVAEELKSYLSDSYVEVSSMGEEEYP